MVDEKKLFEKIDKMNKLMGIMITKDMKVTDQVKLLSEAGLTSKEIAEITGKTSNFVNVTKHKLKKNGWKTGYRKWHRIKKKTKENY